MELRLIHAVEYGKSWLAEWEEYELFGIHNGIDKEGYDEVSE